MSNGNISITICLTENVHDLECKYHNNARTNSRNILNLRSRPDLSLVSRFFRREVVPFPAKPPLQVKVWFRLSTLGLGLGLG